MKVLHINFSDKRGGAAIAAYRHHEAMLRRGIDSKMLVLDKTSNDPDVMVIQTNSFRRFVLRCINKTVYCSEFRRKKMKPEGLFKFGGKIVNLVNAFCLHHP